MDPVATYNAIADRYQEITEGKADNVLIDFPTVMRLIQPEEIANQAVLDLGCGSGRYTREIIRLGGQATGIDPSSGLLAVAQKEVPGATFVEGRAEHLPFPDASFAMVISGLVVDHIEDLASAFREVYRVLAPRGIFVFSRPNPVTEATVKKDGRYEFDHYFEEGWRLSPMKAFGVDRPYYHHTYETVINGLLDAGFILEKYADARPVEACRERFPETYEKEMNKPHFCAFRGRKG